MNGNSDIMNTNISNKLDKTVKPFNASDCKLMGSNLLEASAGTGKTYSLSFLYLRFIIENRLEVEQILVTTFTNAAVAELRSRVYLRLLESETIFKFILVFKQENTELSADEFIEQYNTYFADYLQVKDSQVDESLVCYLFDFIGADSNVDVTSIDNDPLNEIDKIEQSIKRLQLARANFNQSQILTIDGFALQLLQNNYVSLQSYEALNIVNNHADIIKDIYIDLARNGFDDCTGFRAEMAIILVEKSLDSMSEILTNAIENITEIENSEPTIWEDSDKVEAEVEQLFKFDFRLIYDELLNAIEQKQLDGSTYKKASLLKYLEVLEQRNVELLLSSTDAFNRFFTSKQLGEKSKGFVPEQSHQFEFYQLFESIMQKRFSYCSAKQKLFHETCFILSKYIFNKIPEYVAENLVHSYNDITTIIELAASAGNLQTDLQVALIDEAQDTSAKQVSIFENLFINSQKICFFVGDPKQAIYAFRGADIFAYLNLQSKVDNVYVLDTNYRSSYALNASINEIFSRQNIFLQQGINYHSVNSKAQNITDSSSDKLVDKSLDIVPVLSETGTVLINDITQSCAGYVSQLLQSESEIDGKLWSHKDIAILVGSNSQAEKIKLALSNLGISSAFQGKKGVFESEEAHYFNWLINAVFNLDYRSIKLVLLSPLYRYSLSEISTLSDLLKDNGEQKQTTNLLSDILGRFTHYHKLYQERGFSYAFYYLFIEESICANLLNDIDGKRRLTNFLHIFELLQEEVKTNELSLYGLSCLLEQKINQSSQSESELRLDDSQAITIQTIHKSKGLEYPVVLHPYMDYHYENPVGNRIVKSNELHQACFGGDNNSSILSAWRKEQEAENIRLSYVALTRAKYKNVVFKTPKDKYEGSSWKQLVPVGNENIYNRVIGADFSEIVNVNDVFVQKNKDSHEYIQRTPRQVRKKYGSKWQLDSFSALSSLVHHDISSNSILEQSEQDIVKSALFDFPKGPNPGTALHEMFEGFMENRKDFTQHIKQALQKNLPTENFSEEMIMQLNDELMTVTTVSLFPKSFCLSDINREKQSIEMEFFLHLSVDSRNELFNLFEQIPYSQAQGYLHGFIDLMFFHEGKYYILDYKSNYLGGTFADYNQNNMQTAMHQHHYDLQALIYTVALCKHLINTLPDFDYERDIGGAYYLFIRGMNTIGENLTENLGIHFHKPKWNEIKNLVLDDAEKSKLEPSND